MTKNIQHNSIIGKLLTLLAELATSLDLKLAYTRG